MATEGWLDAAVHESKKQLQDDDIKRITAEDVKREGAWVWHLIRKIDPRRCQRPYAFVHARDIQRWTRDEYRRRWGRIRSWWRSQIVRNSTMAKTTLVRACRVHSRPRPEDVQ